MRKLSIGLLILSFITALGCFAAHLSATALTSATASYQSATLGRSMYDFSYHVKVMPSAQSSVQQFLLSEDIYRASQSRHLYDLRVFDRDNNPMPFMIGKQSPSSAEIQRPAIIYPLYQKKLLSSQTEQTDLYYDKQQKLVTITRQPFLSDKTSINEKLAQQESNQILGYLIDLNPLAEQTEENSVPKRQRRQLIFNLSTATKTDFLHFNLDASDDLKSWHRLASQQSLAQLVVESEKTSTAHNKLALPDTAARYLRLSITNNPNFKIESVSQVIQTQSKAERLWSDSFSFSKMENENSLVANIPQSIRFNAIRFDLAAETTALKGQLYYQAPGVKKWHAANRFNLYRVINQQQQVVKDSVETRESTAERLKLQLDYPMVKNETFKINAQLGWEPQLLTFLADGKAPYTIAIGNPLVKKQGIAQSQLIASLKEQLEEPIQPVDVIATETNEPTPAALFHSINWQKILLWIVLLVGVLLMALMAKKLLRQIKD